MSSSTPSARRRRGAVPVRSSVAGAAARSAGAPVSQLGHQPGSQAGRAEDRPDRPARRAGGRLAGMAAENPAKAKKTSPAAPSTPSGPTGLVSRAASSAGTGTPPLVTPPVTPGVAAPPT